MQTCTTTDRGFTLLELLVVMLILGLALGTLLSRGLASGVQEQQQVVEAFAREFRLQSQSSVLKGQRFGLDFYLAEDGQTLNWRWLVFAEDGWEPVEEKPGEKPGPGLKGFSGSHAELRIEGLAVAVEAATDLNPDISLSPTREATAFDLLLRDDAGHEDRIRVDLMGRIGINETHVPPL